MSFDWQRYRDLALELYQGSVAPNSDEEARKRCCISRAYYAALMVSRNKLRSEGKNISSIAGSHTGIINEFAHHHDKTRRRIGSRLTDMKEARRMADYDDSVLSYDRHARNTLNNSKKVINDLKNC